MVCKEIWGHLRVYNLLRSVMAEAAHREGVEPCSLSFQAARQVVDGFRAELFKRQRTKRKNCEERPWQR